jgi:hypothetical protein
VSDRYQARLMGNFVAYRMKVYNPIQHRPSFPKIRHNLHEQRLKFEGETGGSKHNFPLLLDSQKNNYKIQNLETSVQFFILIEEYLHI